MSALTDRISAYAIDLVGGKALTKKQKRELGAILKLVEEAEDAQEALAEEMGYREEGSGLYSS